MRLRIYIPVLLSLAIPVWAQDGPPGTSIDLVAPADVFSASFTENTWDVAGENGAGGDPSRVAIVRSLGAEGQGIDAYNPNAAGSAFAYIPVIFAWDRPWELPDTDYFIAFGLRGMRWPRDPWAAFESGVVRGAHPYYNVRSTYDEVSDSVRVEATSEINVGDSLYWLINGPGTAAIPRNDILNDSQDALGEDSGVLYTGFVESGYNEFMGSTPGLQAVYGLEGWVPAPGGYKAWYDYASALYEWRLSAIDMVDGATAASTTSYVLIDNAFPRMAGRASAPELAPDARVFSNMDFRFLSGEAEIDWSVTCGAADSTDRRQQRAFTKSLGGGGTLRYLAWSSDIPRDLVMRLYDDVDIDETETVEAEGTFELRNGVPGEILFAATNTNEGGPGQIDEIVLTGSLNLDGVSEGPGAEETLSGLYSLQCEPHDAAVAFDATGTVDSTGNIGRWAAAEFAIDNVVPTATLEISLAPPGTDCWGVGRSIVGGPGAVLNVARIRLVVSDPDLAGGIAGAGIDYETIQVNITQLRSETTVITVTSMPGDVALVTPAPLPANCGQEYTFEWLVPVTATTGGCKTVQLEVYQDALGNSGTPATAAIAVDSAGPVPTPFELSVYDPPGYWPEELMDVLGGELADVLVTLHVQDPDIPECDIPLFAGVNYDSVSIDAMELNPSAGNLRVGTSVPGEVEFLSGDPGANCNQDYAFAWRVRLNTAAPTALADYMGALDAVGNAGASAEDSIRVDSTPPALGIQVLAGSDFVSPSASGFIGAATRSHVVLDTQDDMSGILLTAANPLGDLSDMFPEGAVPGADAVGPEGISGIVTFTPPQAVLPSLLAVPDQAQVLAYSIEPEPDRIVSATDLVKLGSVFITGLRDGVGHVAAGNEDFVVDNLAPLPLSASVDSVTTVIGEDTVVSRLDIDVILTESDWGTIPQSGINDLQAAIWTGVELLPTNRVLSVTDTSQSSDILIGSPEVTIITITAADGRIVEASAILSLSASDTTHASGLPAGRTYVVSFGVMDRVGSGAVVGVRTTIDLAGNPSELFVEWNPIAPELSPEVDPFDRDQDGVPNAVESTGPPQPNQTNGDLPDSDGDGLLDGTEDENKNGMYDPGETSGRDRDTDADGYQDGIEVLILATDPLDDKKPPQSFTDDDADALPNSVDPDPTDGDADDDRFMDGYEAVILGMLAVTDSVERPVLGDVDINGALDNADAQLILNFFAGDPTPLIDPGRTDLDRNAHIDNADAQTALNYFAFTLPLLPLSR